MISASTRRLFHVGIKCGRRLFTSETPKKPNFSSRYFDDRTLGLVALLFSVPAAAYIWNHHSSSKPDRLFQKENSKDLDIKSEPIKKRKVEYLIIGGGAAGFSAIQAIKEKDPKGQIILVSKESIEPYLRPPLSKELWFSPHDKLPKEHGRTSLSFLDWHGNEKSLSLGNKNYYQDSGVETLLGLEAVGFNLESRQVELSDGQILEFDRLLIATGSDPKLIDAPIDDRIKHLIRPFRTANDFVDLYNSLSGAEGKRVIVIGGGFLGSELAVSISKVAKEKGHSVTQIFPEEGHMGLVFPKYLSQWTTDKLKSLGIEVKAKRFVRSIEADGPDSITSVRLILDNGEEMKGDFVVYAVGVEPSLKGTFKKGLSVDSELGGLASDKFLQVAPGVFAAGDVVSYVDPILGQRRRTEHFDHAVQSGKVAGSNMVRSLKNRDNEPLEEYSSQSMFWSDLGPEVGYEAVGLIDSSLTTIGVWARARPTESPRGTELDASDIRVQPIGETSISTVDPGVLDDQSIRAVEAEIQSGAKEVIEDLSPSYGKGVVFYLKERKIVGILLFNLFNRVNLAKEILKEGHGVNDVSRCVRLFNVEEVA